MIAEAIIGTTIGAGIRTQCNKAVEVFVLGIEVAVIIATGALILHGSPDASLVKPFVTTAFFSLLGSAGGFVGVGRKSQKSAFS